MSPSPANPFALLGIPERFELDRSHLDKAYFQLQARLHPDRFVGKPEAERLSALQKSMAVNEAYQQLKDPQSRAEQLLRLKGVVVNTEKQDTVKPNASLLMEMMELGESLDDVPGAEGFTTWIKARRQELDAAFVQFEEGYQAGRYDEVAQVVIRVQYLKRLIETAERRLKGDSGEAHRAA